MKVVTVLLGANASGKSTLSRQLLGDAKEYYSTVADVRVRVTFGAAGFALAGSLKNGSDSINKIAVLRGTVELLLKHAAVVIVDGFRCAHVFTMFISQLSISDLGAVFVYFDISLEENIRRLIARRRAAGIIEDTLPAKTLAHLLKARKRAWTVFDQARRTYNRQPAAFLILAEGLTPGEAAAKLRAIVEGLGDSQLTAA